LATGSRPITVGRIDYPANEAYLNGQVSEIILVPSAVSVSDRQKFEGYLAWKWDTVASLPGDHPYKSAPPSAALSVTLNSPTEGQAISSGFSVSATATAAGGTPPYTVEFYLDGSGTPASTTPDATSPLTVDLGVLSPGSHTIEATVTDSTSTTVSSGTAVSFSVEEDLTAPTPNPMTFAVAPTPLLTSTSITMTASTATDALSPPVQYYFEDADTPTNNSGWISSATWTNTGLTPGVYGYKVMARDSAMTPNETAFSDVFYATVTAINNWNAADGTWDTSAENWLSPTTWTNGNDAVFSNTASPTLITLSSDLIAGSVTIGDDTNNNANYTFTGGSLTATSFTLQGENFNDLTTAGYPTTTLNNTSLSVTSLVTGRGRLVIDGSSTVTADTIGGPGGGAKGDWGQLTIADTANVTATNGFSADGCTAWGLNLNGGTLTTKGLDYAPHTYGASTNLNFNGTLVKANQTNADFITVSGGLDSGFNPEIQAGGAKIDTNGFDIGIQVPLAGSGALTKSGTGTLTLSEASTYTGKTSVVDGTLALAQAFLNDTADVELTTGATLQLDFATTDISGDLLIDGLPQASGTWGRIDHPTAQNTSSLITGDGLLQVTAGPASGFGSWAADNAPGQTPEQDYDNDGVENGIEYFMGETGSSFTTMPGLDGTNTVTWTKDPAYAGTYEVQTSTDLVTWTPADPQPTPSGGTLSYTLPPGAPGGKSFVRLLVTPTP
jgi:autotransporter-associated beta strand protein